MGNLKGKKGTPGAPSIYGTPMQARHVRLTDEQVAYCNERGGVARYLRELLVRQMGKRVVPGLRNAIERRTKTEKEGKP